MQTYNKLVRDKIPEFLDSKGIAYEKRIASPEEYKIELIKKLHEEIGEFEEGYSVEELADILEVLEAIKLLPGYEEVEVIRQKKLIEKGGFHDWIILKGEK